ncbi:hypothetical protein [Corynebacterium nuruki]|uniref:hypothetical protein n=1 Tax=Corynebacterium nuruki TaxID=1032851 RepID=UPI0039BEDF64
MSTTDIGIITANELNTWWAYRAATSGDAALADRLDTLSAWAERFEPSATLPTLDRLGVAVALDRELLDTLRTVIGQITSDLDLVTRKVSEITGVAMQRPAVTMAHLVTPYFAVAEFAEEHGLVLVSPGEHVAAA